MYIIIHPVSIRFLPRSRRWPDTPHFLCDRSHTFPPSRSIFNPTFFTLSSTCLLHVIFGSAHFRCLFTYGIIAFLSVLSSPLLITCPYHLTPVAFAVLSNVSFKLKISISYSIFFLSTNFTPHIDLTMAVSVPRKLAISLSLKHHVSLPYNIAK